MIQRKRCIFILIDTTIDPNETDSIDQRILQLKNQIIQRMKSIVQSAEQGDLIQINSCSNKLTQPPLIPFCQTKQLLTEQNLRRIENLQFKQSSETNLLLCVDAAHRQMARQLTFYRDLLLFRINSLDLSKESPTNLRRLQRYRTVNKQLIHLPQQNHSHSEHHQMIQIDLLHSFTGPTVHSNPHPNGSQREIIIHYGHRNSSANLLPTRMKTSSESEIPPRQTHSTIHYQHIQTSNDKSSNILDNSSLRLRRETIPPLQSSMKKIIPMKDSFNEQRPSSSTRPINFFQFSFKPGFK